MTEPKVLKSVAQHNKERRQANLEAAKTGIACPYCGKELYNPSPGIVLTSTPPKMRLLCSNCDTQQYVLA